MDAGGEQVGEGVVDESLAGDAGQTGEGGAFDIDAEMGLAGAVVAHMAGMHRAFVGDDEVGRGERIGETGGDLFGDGAGGEVGHRAYIARFGRCGEPVAGTNDKREKPSPRFHGRVAGTGRVCMAPGCEEPGEFRAPPLEGASDAPGPPMFRWFCLDHVRAFNSRYNFFDGMTADEIHHAQRPLAGWERETRAFAHAGGDKPPKWSDFSDPLDAIATRFRREVAPERSDGKPLSGQDRASLKVLGLAANADRGALRKRYSELVRQYHPDRNGGDRSHEVMLQKVIAAYQQLRQAPAFV